jgi:hypothetical protein
MQRIPSDDLESQGEGTWIEVRKQVGFDQLRPVIELAQWREDPRIKGEQPGQADAMLEMLDGFDVALWPLVRAWNWVTDMEAELSSAPETNGQSVMLRLATPIWAESDFCTVDEDSQSAPPDIEGLPVYLGSYPDDYQVVFVEGVSEDGRMLTCRGELTREYEPDEHYAIVGLPVPDSPGAFSWLSLDEIMWIINTFAQRFRDEAKRREGRRHPKVTA